MAGMDTTALGHIEKVNQWNNGRPAGQSQAGVIVILGVIEALGLCLQDAETYSCLARP